MESAHPLRVPARRGIIFVVVPTMILIGALVSVFTRWWISVAAGAVVWSLLLISHADISLAERPLVALLGAANAAVGGLWGAAIRRLAFRLTPA